MSGQIMIFTYIYQPGFFWNKGMSFSQLHFGVRSCEVAIIWPDMLCWAYQTFKSIDKNQKLLALTCSDYQALTVTVSLKAAKP